ncbi:ClpP-like prohead protease/major capsid protein fusion protein [Comamonas sp.]|uniref:ClpP-like prohead protease/major capsid protein fusion protein n=1 Tax=Comamonas sp. TaxID=34028 RepID=UPI003A9317A2
MSTSQKWFAIRRKTAQAAAAAGVVSAAEILIYGDIGESWWEETTNARDFVAELQALDVQAITVRINSLGGSVPDGFAIYNAMKRHPATITTEVDGMAFSIASLIAMGGDKVCMAENAMLMVHAPWTYAAGNAVELRDMADQLDTWAAAMATSYARKTGNHDAVMALLTDGKDHFFTAAEALADGFIDAITDASPVAASAARDLPLSRYRSLPAALLRADGTSAAPAAQSAPEEDNMKINRTHVLMNAIGASGASAAGGGSAAPAAAATPAVPDAAAPAAVLAADQTRRQSIRASFAAFAGRDGVQDLQRQCEDDHSVCAAAAGARLLAHLGSQASPVAGASVTTVEDEGDKRRDAAVAALLVRAGYASKDQASAHSGNPYRGMSLVEMARASLESAGVNAKGKDKRELVAAAFTQSTSDFPILLTDAIHRVLLSAYAVQALTWQRFCKRGQVSDFREHHRFRVGSLGNLQPKGENGEYKNVHIPDGEKSSIAAGTKGFIINLSREMIINDDLGAFADQAAAMGRSAARTVEADVYALLGENNGLGPTMLDGKPLLHASHGNVVTEAAAPSSAAFEAFRILMAKHKDVSGNDFLDLRPAVWLGPVGLEGRAKLINKSEFEISTDVNPLTPNVGLGMFRDIVGSPRLDGTRYYAFADVNEGAALEVAFLDGVDTPFIEQEDAFDTDGARFKVRLDYGVAAHDYRCVATNAGQ